MHTVRPYTHHCELNTMCIHWNASSFMVTQKEHNPKNKYKLKRKENPRWQPFSSNWECAKVNEKRKKTDFFEGGMCDKRKKKEDKWWQCEDKNCMNDF